MAHGQPWLAQGRGFAPWKGQFDFEAPAEGYQETNEITVAKIAERWLDSEEQRLFIKTKDKKYGCIKLGIAADGNPTPFFYMKGYYNPSGSRNLESDRKKLVDPKRVAQVGLAKAIEEVEAASKTPTPP